MRAIRVHACGGPDVLALEELPTPEPGVGEALVKLEWAGVNYIDVYHRSGLYPRPLPLTPGQEGAGVVVARGDRDCAFPIGERVAWASAPASYAEYVSVAADRLVPLAEGVSTRDAAACLLQGMTAHYLVRSTYPLKAGDSCLIHAAAGGVGQLLCQLAKLSGARVLATVAGAEKVALARAAGADEVIDYAREDFAERVRELCQGRGVAVVYDSVGAATYEASLACLAPRGMLVLFGQSSGSVPPLDPQRLAAGGSLYLTRPSLHHYTQSREELLWRAGEVLDLVRSGRLRVRVDRELALADAAEAHRLLEGRRTTGKLLLRP